LLEKSLRLLGDVLTDPLLENGVFKEDIVAKEKRALKQRIQAVFDDKMRYANLRLVEEMCKNEPYHLHVNGRLEDIEGITAQSLYDYYKKMLTENSADLYVIGDIQEDEVVQYTKDIFSFEKRGVSKISPPAQMSVEKENVVEEKQPVKQGKLNMGYRTNIVYGDDD
jgi:predicted Zn-dependent peptidase